MEVFLDESWVNLRRIDDDYKRALDSFLDFAMVSNAVENKIACLCRICGNRKYYEREVVRNHLIMRGMYKAHDPKKKLDANTAAKKKQLDDELAKLSESCSAVERNVVFKKVMGEDSNGYAKTYGKGVVVPRSQKKRCALVEERAKRLKTEEDVANMKKELEFMKNLMIKMAMQQGMNVGSSSGQAEAGGEECGENCENMQDAGEGEMQSANEGNEISGDGK